MIGDGFGVSSVTAARIFEGQQRGIDGESNRLAFEDLPYLALSKTYAHDMQVSDSASTATAMVSGVKTNGRTLGVNSSAKYDDCSTEADARVTSVFAMAEAQGRATGIVSTTTITHATPASTFAHTVNRDWENDAEMGEAYGPCTDIARQLVEWPIGNGLEVAFGGGRENFLPAETPDPEDAETMGLRQDGRNLISEWQTRYGENAAYVWNALQFASLEPEKVDHALGLFDYHHMEYEAERSGDAGGEPSIAEMTGKAIDILSKNQTGFFLMVEGGRIDHGSHAGEALKMLTDAVAFNDAVKTVLEKVDLDETLVIVTADHSHTLTISGYPARGNQILELVKGPDGNVLPASDGKPYTTLGYANGPGAITAPERPDLSRTDVTALGFKQQALVPTRSETHAGEDVAIYAGGPWAHLFQNTVEQNFIYHVIHHAAGL